MIEEHAIVVSVNDGEVWVETQRQSSCTACSANKGCGTAVLSKALGRRTNSIRVLNSLDVKPGEEVVIGIEEKSLVRGSVAVYLMPLLFMFLFALSGEWLAGKQHWNNTELAAIVGAILGLMIGVYWLKRFSRKIYRDQRYQPVILRKNTVSSTINLNIISG